VGVKDDVQASYIRNAEVVEAAPRLLPVVSPHPLDLLTSPATFAVFVGAHWNDLSHPCVHPPLSLLGDFGQWLMALLTLPMLAAATVMDVVGPAVGDCGVAASPIWALNFGEDVALSLWLSVLVAGETSSWREKPQLAAGGHG
jgi:hypothetical protein